MVVTYATGVAVLDLLTHRTGLRIRPASWCCKDAIDSIVSQREHCMYLFDLVFFFVVVVLIEIALDLFIFNQNAGFFIDAYLLRDLK